MLSRDDILTELRSLKGILGVESSERAWADDLVQEYSRRYALKNGVERQLC